MISFTTRLIVLIITSTMCVCARQLFVHPSFALPSPAEQPPACCWGLSHGSGTAHVNLHAVA